MAKPNLSALAFACSMASQPSKLMRKGQSVRAEGKRQLIALLRSDHPLTTDDRQILADLLDGKLKRGRSYDSQGDLEHGYNRSKAIALANEIRSKTRCSVEVACSSALQQMGVTLDPEGERVEWLINARREHQRRSTSR